MKCQGQIEAYHLRKAGEQGLGVVYAYLVEDSHLSRVQLVEKAANYVADARWSGVVNESFKGQVTTHPLSFFRGLESANTLRMSVREVFEAGSLFDYRSPEVLLACDGLFARGLWDHDVGKPARRYLGVSACL